MSWYKRKPRLKEPPKHLPHHRHSPISDKILEEVKKQQAPEKKSGKDSTQ